MTIRPTPLVIAAALGLAAATSAVQAQPAVQEVIVRAPAPPPAGVELKTKTVSFADLDLSTAAGAETLVGRIHGAAVQVCMPLPTHPADSRDVADYNKCEDGAMAQAVGDTMNPLVEQVYDRTWK